MWVTATAILLLTGCGEAKPSGPTSPTPKTTAARQEVVFWHFWGGADRDVVEDIVRQFNQQQPRYFVRPIAMPGNNLQAKLFLSVAGGDPPDLVNQDDPVLADWARRGVIEPMSNAASEDDVAAVRRSLLPPARKLSVVDDKLYAVCNGLDIRALLYNATAIEQAGFAPPQTIQQLDAIATHFAPPDPSQRLRSPVGYLPDSRRLWAWGSVFGADFCKGKDSANGPQVQIDSPQLDAALNWMSDYGRRYGADNLAAFRQGDQSLPGKTFLLLPKDDQSQVGRYVVMMDGQWRTRDIMAFEQRRATQKLPAVKFGVCPLPFPDSNSDDQPDLPARKNAGWVNGNFFVVPAGAKCPQGAWEFAKFWIGQSTLPIAAHETAAHETAAQWYAKGGWIPVTQDVIESENYRRYIAANPLMETFVRLASSPDQYPIPNVTGAAMLKREVENMTYDAMMQAGDAAAVSRILKQRGASIEAKVNSLPQEPRP